MLKTLFLAVGLSACLLLVVCVVCGFVLFPHQDTPYLAVEMASNASSYAKLSVSFTQNGTQRDTHSFARIASDPDAHTYTFALPYERIESLRIRPIACQGIVSISAMAIHDASGRRVRTIRLSACRLSNNVPANTEKGKLVLHFCKESAFVIAKLQKPIMFARPGTVSKLPYFQVLPPAGIVVFCLLVWLMAGPCRKRDWARWALYLALSGLILSLLDLSAAPMVQLCQALLFLAVGVCILLYFYKYTPPPPPIRLNINTSTCFSFDKILFFVCVPVGLYFAVFLLFTYPLMDYFSSHFFVNSGDGCQMIWNIWWVNRAITTGQNPWFTHMLFHPSGVSLLGATLHSLKGFMAVPLLWLFSFTETYNIIVILTFLVAGLGAFLLAYAVCRSYTGSLAAGFFFSFYNYHFAHAQGHLNLISYEFLPLFILSILMLVSRPRMVWGLFSGVFLFMIILCDYYYFVYAVAAAVLLYLYQAWSKRTLLFGLRKPFAKPMATFLVVTCFTAGVLCASFVAYNMRNPFIGGHIPEEHSLDLVNPVVPGFHWYFANLTRAVWQQCVGNKHENSVHLGIALIILVLAAWFSKYRKRLMVYFVLAAVFLVMAFGPYLHVLGHRLQLLRLPYKHMLTLLPVAGIGGMPIRMMIMVMLFVTVIAAWSIKHLIRQKAYLGIALLFILAVIEYLPRPMPMLRLYFTSPAHVLSKIHSTDYAVVDLSRLHTRQGEIIPQICHGKPIIGGYLARTPEKQHEQHVAIRRLINKQKWRELLKTYNVRYVIKHKDHRLISSLRQYEILYQDKVHIIFDLMLPISTK